MRSHPRLLHTMALMMLGTVGSVAAWTADAPAPGAAAGGLAIPASRSTVSSLAQPVPAPQRVITTHSITIAGKRIDYHAIAGETTLYNRAAEPIGSMYSFSYLKDGPRDARRPVMFIFNGGPGSSSVWLHMGSIGPRHVVLDKAVDPSNVPPFGVTDNPDSILDVADLVFIDPIGTGFSRVTGKGTTADFWGVDEDADSVAQFIELWLTEHGRWNSPKFLMGESYGSIRAALLPRALMGGPTYTGVMRGITVNGIVLLGTLFDIGEQPPREGAEMRAALALPALADTAWYHQKIDRAGRSLEAFHAEVLAFAQNQYAPALQREKAALLTPAERTAIAAKLAAYTGLPAPAFDKSLGLSAGAFAHQLLADRGLQVGAYDSRYTLPLANSGNEPVADDPAMGRYVPGFVAAFHAMLADDLNVHLDRPYGAIVWKDLLPAWNWSRTGVPAGQSLATDLAVAMRRNPQLQVLVASGYYDLVTHSAVAEQAAQHSGWPADRVTLKRYESGHMLYLGNTAGAFASDLRTLIRSASK